MNGVRRNRWRAFHQSLWGWPIAMALLSGVGLVAALVGDGAWDLVSWAALGIPTAVCLWLGLRKQPGHNGQRGRIGG